MRFLKLILRAAFTAHFIAFLFLASLAYNVLGLVGKAPTPSVRTLEDALVMIALFGVLVALGWLAGNEARGANVRRLTRERDHALAHGAYLRGLNAEMIDDVMAAASAGIKVKSLRYTFASRDAQAEYLEDNPLERPLSWYAKRHDAKEGEANEQLTPEAKAALFEAAGLRREAREFDYGGRL
jgi:hypothetical protein